MRNAQYRAVNGARPDEQSAEEAAIAEFKIGAGSGVFVRPNDD